MMKHLFLKSFRYCTYSIFLLLTFGLVSGCANDIPINIDDPLESRGSYDVHISSVSIPNPEDSEKSFSGKIYFPSQDGGTSRESGDYTLILLTPGFSASFTLYERFAKHFVSHGFVVLGFNFVPSATSTDGEHDYKARQIGYAIDFIVSEASGISDYIDPTNVGLVGHSMGGKASFYAASIDQRINAIAALDPSNAGGPPCFISPSNCAAYPVAPNPTRETFGILNHIQVASLIIRSAPDPLFNPAEEFNASWFFYGYDGNGLYAVPSPAVYIDMGKVSHAAYIPLISRPVASFLKRTMTAWFMTHLRGEPMPEYYDGDIIQTDINKGLILAVDYRE
ncbi:MAG: alpha/beta fold hydrolase [Pseudomonadales bacterium]|nr:alpha/beta fold hydrolase [Pseudomonadales bacterium]